MATAFKVRYTSDYAKYVEQLAQFEAHLTSNYADLFIKHEFFGVQVQPGWWPLVESMCQTLQQYVSMHPDIGLKVYDFHTMHGQLAARMDYADLFVAGVMAMAKVSSVIFVMYAWHLFDSKPPLNSYRTCPKSCAKNVANPAGCVYFMMVLVAKKSCAKAIAKSKWSCALNIAFSFCGLKQMAFTTRGSAFALHSTATPHLCG